MESGKAALRITQLEDAARARLLDAQCLLLRGRWRGAAYLAGYVVEFMLKVRIGKRYRVVTLQELGPVWPRRDLEALVGARGHDLEWLRQKAGVQPGRGEELSWVILHTRWRVDQRYRGNEGFPRFEAARVVASAEVLYRWLRRLE